MDDNKEEVLNEKMQNLKQMNKNYSSKTSSARQSKDKKSALYKNIEALGKEIKTAERKLDDIKTKLARAKEDKNKADINKFEKEQEKAKKDVQAKKNKLEKIQATIAKAQKEIDEKVTELSKDTELTEHLKIALGVKFERKIKHNQKEIKERNSENKQLEKIKEDATNNRAVMQMIMNIEDSLLSIDECNEILKNKKSTPTEKAKATSDLAKFQSDLQKGRDSLYKHYKGRISKDVIEKVSSFESISRTIRSNNRSNKYAQKQINVHSQALENMGIAIDGRSGSYQPAQPQPQPQPQNNPPLPVPQPKWWQVIKKFNNWRNARKTAKEGYTGSEPQPTKLEDLVKHDKESDFKDSLRFDVVRDYKDKLEKDLLNQAKQQITPEQQQAYDDIDDGSR